MPQTKEQKARRKELDFINKDKIREQRKDYDLKNKDKIKEQKNAWYLENRDKMAIHNKEYNLKNHRQNTINQWIKQGKQGLICDDYDALYDYYISVKNCEICCVELTDGKPCNTRRAMDHSHSTGEFRNVLCNNCNIHLKE